MLHLPQDLYVSCSSAILQLLISVASHARRHTMCLYACERLLWTQTYRYRLHLKPAWAPHRARAFPGSRLRSLRRRVRYCGSVKYGVCQPRYRQLDRRLHKPDDETIFQGPSVSTGNPDDFYTSELVNITDTDVLHQHAIRLDSLVQCDKILLSKCQSPCLRAHPLGTRITRPEHERLYTEMGNSSLFSLHSAVTGRTLSLTSSSCNALRRHP